ncbi:hypothetical protein TNCV_3590141 [Trichonephila clavipes]|nr:hypothetical protein TNCV_3590141 [Trichonephila clavipes]
MAFSSSTQISASITLLPPPRKIEVLRWNLVPKRKRIPIQEEILQLMHKSDFELCDLSDDDYAADKTYETRMLEGKSSSDKRDEENHGNICNGKTILDPS